SYKGLPRNSPTTSPYFSLPPHDKNKDQYSISFAFTPTTSINANDLVFGNDFDHPIRDRLPPGFNTALKIVKWVADPGLDGDVYAEKPYLYGPAASSVNTLHVGSKGGDSKVMGKNGEGLVWEEGGDEEGGKVRKEGGVPDGEAARKKFFLTESNRSGWEWEAGRTYGCDFFNPYLDFNEFALNLPGFKLPIMKYWDGQPLRYVLKNRATDKVLFVVLFTLYLKDDVNEDGSVKDGVEGGKPLELLGEKERERHEKAKNAEGGEVEGAQKENAKPAEGEGKVDDGTSADDVD
ncbi:UPF0590 protein, partial [Lachnellula suecica]